MKENLIQKKINRYKKKYYINFFIKSILLSFSLILSAFLFYNLLEYFARFNSTVRFILFSSYLLILLFVFFKWIIIPLIRIFIDSMQISNEEAAKKIGNYFPDISDKLLNILQLEKLESERKDLINASINQKTGEIDHISFDRAISFSSNRRYLIYLIIPLVAVLFLGLSFPNVIVDGTTRIVNFNREYKPVAPFDFVIKNDSFLAFKNEDFDLEIAIAGEMIPENVYLDLGERKIKLPSQNKTDYNYTFQKLSRNVSFNLEAAGFSSENFEIEVVNRPNIKNFNVELDYPSYLKRKSERLSNVGNLQIPEGTRVNWNYQTIYTDSLYMKFSPSEEVSIIKESDNQIFTYEKLVNRSQDYEIILTNEYTDNKDRIIYHMEVIPDEYPRISVNQFSDTILYEFLILGGNISDDYGFRDLSLYYKIFSGPKNEQFSEYEKISLSIDPGKNSQNFYYNWDIDTLNLSQSDNIEYYLEVRDNDGINGSKSSRTGLYYFSIPDREELREDLEKTSQAAESQIDKSLEKAKELNESIDEMRDRLKGKRQLNWQEQKLLEDILKKKESLNDDIIDLQELNKANMDKQERFSELDDDMKQKIEQLQEIMEELLDEESKKLYEELAKLLEETKDIEQIKNMLENLDMNEKNLERDLERALELFKRLKYEQKLDELVDDLSDLQEKQQELSEETENENKEFDQLSEEQEQLNKEYEEFEKSYEELRDMNQQLQFPNRIENTLEEEENIKKEQQEALENLKQGQRLEQENQDMGKQNKPGGKQNKSNENSSQQKRNNASQSQQNATQEMQKMSAKLESMQTSGQMMQMMENFNDLREIVDNLLKLSFEQEEIMNGFKTINQSDPRFLEYSERQLKLKDDAKVIEDSLIALSKRVMQISSFITREVSEMNKYMEESMDALKERKKAEAVGKQQFSMTSMNNLALLLDDVLNMMQQQLANMMALPNPANQPQNNPQLSELQKQLNDQIGKLKESGKTGRELSEELAKLAAEQEKIRRQLEEEQGKLDQINGKDGSLGELINKMEETELDLVNKQITQRLIQRQREILTRLLEAEDAMREQELDKDREAKTAEKIQREIPPEFEKYFKAKEKEIELLRTLPPKLNPYYKKEVMEYFNRLETTYK